jgi:ribosomal protein RSM22 (predicted rRNA methylase)
MQADLAARALFFTPADAAKILVPLAELEARRLISDGPVSLLDLGCGVGAMTLGAFAALSPRELSVTAVDRDAAGLRIFAATIEALGAEGRLPIALSTVADDVLRWTQSQPRPTDSGWSLIAVGSVLNELPVADRLRLVRELIGRLHPRGALILIEPALRQTARDLHRLRDQVIAEELATVFSPCTRQRGGCPALTEERDWCHEDRSAALPPRTAELAAATGLREHGLKFAYLVLRRDGESIAPESATAWRVVSQPRRLKGQRECFACGAPGRVRLRLLHRDRTPRNRAFEEAARGDLLVFAGETLGAESQVSVQRVSSSRPA